MTHALSDASMPASAEWLIRTLRTLADAAETIIDFLSFFSLVFLDGLSCDSAFIGPSVWVPGGAILPNQGVHLRDTWACHKKVALGDNIRCDFSLRWRRERVWNWNVGNDLAHDGTEGKRSDINMGIRIFPCREATYWSGAC